MRPSFTSKAPSCNGGDETGIRVPAAKITGPAWFSGIPPDHLRGHGLQKLAFRDVGQEAFASQGGVFPPPGPPSVSGAGFRGEPAFIPRLEQFRRRARVGEDAPDR